SPPSWSRSCCSPRPASPPSSASARPTRRCRRRPSTRSRASRRTSPPSPGRTDDHRRAPRRPAGGRRRHRGRHPPHARRAARHRRRALRQARRRSTRPAVPRAGARRRPHPGGAAPARDARARRGRRRRCGGAAPGPLPPMSRHAGAGEARAPEGPTDLTKPSWTYVLRRTVREMLRDQCTDLAAALTYYSVLSLFPALIAMLSLLALTGQQEDTVATVLDTLRQAGAASAADTLEPVLTELSQTPRAGLVLIGGLAVALWSASNYVNSFGRAMNRIYEIDEGRPIWKL